MKNCFYGPPRLRQCGDSKQGNGEKGDQRGNKDRDYERVGQSPFSLNKPDSVSASLRQVCVKLFGCQLQP